MNVSGIDVGYKTVVVAISKNGKQGKQRTFENTPSGHQELKKVPHSARVTRVGLEATGVYHPELAVALHESNRFELMVINPKAASHYATARMTRSKTDAVDTAMLAEFVERMPFEPWQCPDDSKLALRTASRRLEALVKQQTQAKNHLHAFLRNRFSPAFVIEDIELTLAQLGHRIEAMQTHILSLIEQNDELQTIFNRIDYGQGYRLQERRRSYGRTFGAAQRHDRQAVGGDGGPGPTPASIRNQRRQTRAYQQGRQ